MTMRRCYSTRHSYQAVLENRAEALGSKIFPLFGDKKYKWMLLRPGLADRFWNMRSLADIGEMLDELEAEQ